MEFCVELWDHLEIQGDLDQRLLINKTLMDKLDLKGSRYLNKGFYLNYLQRGFTLRHCFDHCFDTIKWYNMTYWGDFFLLSDWCLTAGSSGIKIYLDFLQA